MSYIGASGARVNEDTIRAVKGWQGGYSMFAISQVQRHGHIVICIFMHLYIELF